MSFTWRSARSRGFSLGGKLPRHDSAPFRISRGRSLESRIWPCASFTSAPAIFSQTAWEGGAVTASSAVALAPKIDQYVQNSNPHAHPCYPFPG